VECLEVCERRKERKGMGVEDEVDVYSPFGAEGGGDVCVLVRGEKCVIIRWQLVEEVCVR
jgi:hypothetical protein